MISAIGPTATSLPAWPPSPSSRRRGSKYGSRGSGGGGGTSVVGGAGAPVSVGDHPARMKGASPAEPIAAAPTTTKPRAPGARSAAEGHADGAELFGRGCSSRAGRRSRDPAPSRRSPRPAQSPAWGRAGATARGRRAASSGVNSQSANVPLSRGHQADDAMQRAAQQRMQREVDDNHAEPAQARHRPPHPRRGRSQASSKTRCSVRLAQRREDDQQDAGDRDRGARRGRGKRRVHGVSAVARQIEALDHRVGERGAVLELSDAKTISSGISALNAWAPTTSDLSTISIASRRSTMRRASARSCPIRTPPRTPANPPSRARRPAASRSPHPARSG